MVTEGGIGLSYMQLLLWVASSPRLLQAVAYIYGFLLSDMATMDNRKMYFATDIVPGIGLWSVNVQVVENHRSQVSKAKDGTPQKTFKRFLLVDEQGTKLSGIIYENDFQHFSNSFQQFKRYRISNARLNPAYGFFRVSDYGYSWVIKSETPVEPLAEDIVQTIPFTYDVCPFNEFLNNADKDTGFNVKGIVVHSFPPREIGLTSRQREFVLIDESMTPTIMTLWNSFADIEGKILADNIAKNPFVIGVNMKATTFHGLSLATRMYSCILIDPPTADNHILKQWYTANRSAITKLIKTKAYKQTDMLLPPPDLAQAIDVPTALATLPTINSSWVSGRLRFTPSSQPYFLCACANCHTKADTGSDWILLCSSCGAHEEVKLRCRVPVHLEGEGKSIQVVLTSPDVERLTNLTAEQMRDSHQYDFNVNDDLLLSLDKLHVVCFVKKYDPKTMGSTRTPGLRFSVVKTYSIDSIKPKDLTEASSSKTKSEATSYANLHVNFNTKPCEEFSGQESEIAQETRQNTISPNESAKADADHEITRQKASYGDGRPNKRSKNK